MAGEDGPEGLDQTIFCEPIAVSDGFALCREIGDDTVVHIHDRRRSSTGERVALVRRTPTGWALEAPGVALPGGEIADIFDGWLDYARHPDADLPRSRLLTHPAKS